MSEDEMYAALVPALLDIRCIPDLLSLSSREAEHLGTELLPAVRRIVATELRAAAYDVDDGEFSSRESAAARAALLARADELDPS